MTLKTKICGVTKPDVLRAAIDNGADYVGFVFFPRSPRHIGLALARTLADEARGRIETVALVVNPSDEDLKTIEAELKPDFFQLHGDETVERVATIRNAVNAGLIKAVKVAGPDDVSGAQAFEAVADIVLFDAYVTPSETSLPGGNGASFEWSWLKKASLRPNFMLSGGLNPDNVQAAIEASDATAVDVSSGVETAPGVKSIELIERFIARAKSLPQSA